MKEEKKKSFANNKNKGALITKKKKKAFTLIELLAIIVILAIIAVITVPIILNIIENSRKGAATDSAYGYKDAVNKAYIQELAKPNNENLKLNGTYEVQSDGTLVPADGYSFGITNYNTLPVSVSGEKPTSGTLIYDNNVLASGTLIIGDYTATYSNGSFTTVKTGSSSGTQVDQYSMTAMCPGCKFSGDEQMLGAELSTVLEDDYSELGNYFFGYVTSNNYVERLFICGTEKNNTFCLEGGSLDEVDSFFEKNVNILNHYFDNCDYIDSDVFSCQSSTGDGYATTKLNKDMATIYSDIESCTFNIECTSYECFTGSFCN